MSHSPHRTFSAVLSERAASLRDKTAVVDDRRRLSYAELDALATRAAAGLADHGIGAGTVVSSLLPNRAEAAILFHALNRLGAVLNPIVPIYGAREIRFILRQMETTAVVVADRFRGADSAALIERLRADVPSLQRVFVAGDASLSATTPFDELLEPREHRAVAPRQREADEVTVVLYTSGTTADPKGVLHSNDTLLAECLATQRYHRLGSDEVFVMPSPVSHISGLLYGIMLPCVLGATSVLMETWEPEAFLALVERERGTYSAGATPFLQGVVECPRLDRYDVTSLRRFPCGGADVPPELIRRAMRRLGARSGRGYGSTEFPSITSSAGPDVPDEKRAETDGAPIGPNEIELRDLDGRPVPAGREGQIWARGPELFLGYRDASLDRAAFDERRFFATGDLGVLDRDGYLTITGRLKDIIIRSGEKFSAKEIEDLLFEHPKVRSVAVIPVPDAKVGERVCAIVLPQNGGAPPTLAELTAFLESREISRRKLPERMLLVEEMPMTASGKILKHVLKERAARELGAEGERK
jgi:cyclohexanecarboxylate-CoA ligase